MAAFILTVPLPADEQTTKHLLGILASNKDVADAFNLALKASVFFSECECCGIWAILHCLALIVKQSEQLTASKAIPRVVTPTLAAAAAAEAPGSASCKRSAQVAAAGDQGGPTILGTGAGSSGPVRAKGICACGNKTAKKTGGKSNGTKCNTCKAAILQAQRCAKAQKSKAQKR